MSDYSKAIQNQLKQVQETVANKKSQTVKDPSEYFKHVVKVARYLFSYDQPHFFIPMHDFFLAPKFLIHLKNELGEGRESNNQFVHRLCMNVANDGEEGLCEPCKKSKTCFPADSWKYEPQIVKAFVGFSFNALGSKREYEQDGEKRIFYVNPINSFEFNLGSKGTNDSTLALLSKFEFSEKMKRFNGTIFEVFLNSGKKEGTKKGFEDINILEPEELASKIGKEGFEPELPGYANDWVSKIKDLKKQDIKLAEQEIKSLLLTSFSNGKEFAERSGIKLPEKPIKENKPFTLSS